MVDFKKETIKGNVKASQSDINYICQSCTSDDIDSTEEEEGGGGPQGSEEDFCDFGTDWKSTSSASFCYR